MSGSIYFSSLLNLGIVAIFALGLILYCLTSFYAFRVRKALLVPLYRYQALWIGAGGAYWVVFSLLFGIPFELQILDPSLLTAQFNTDFSVLLFASLYFGLVLFFGWVDTMARVARNSDPRNKDILGWSRLRLFLWTSIAVGLALGSVFVAPGILRGSEGSPITNLVLFYAYSSPIFFLTSGVGALVLLIGASRSGDVMLRNQLKWLGLFILLLFLNVTTAVAAVVLTGGLSFDFSGANTVVGIGVEGAITFAQAFALYKAAVSLVPTSRFSRPD